MAEGEVKMNFVSKGLSKIRSDIGGFAGDLLEPGLVLATGGSKAQAAWAGVSSLLVTRVLGPVTLLVGVTTGLLGLFKRLVGTTQLLAEGLKAVKEIEMLETQFAPLLGGINRARMRIKELYDFAAKTPFQIGDIAGASRTLEVLTKGALSTGKELKMVGDAAAVTGQGFQSVSFWVGRLYDGLQSGRPVGEAMMRMQEMGLVSGTTRAKIEQMQKTGASTNDMWAVMQKELKKTEGGMEDLSQTLGGLETTLADTKKLFAAKFSEGFLDTEKRAVKDSIVLYEAFQPAIETLGDAMSFIPDKLSAMKSGFIQNVVGTKAFASTMSVLVKALYGLTAASVAVVSANIARSLFQMAAGTLASTSATKLATFWEAVRTGQLRAAGTAFMAMTIAEKGNAIATGAWIAVTKVATFVTSMFTSAIIASFRALLMNPLGLIITLLVAAATSLFFMIKASNAATKAAGELRDAGRELVKGLEEERRAIKDVDDKYNNLAKTYKEIRNAKEKLASLKEEDKSDKEINAQQDVVAMLERQANMVRGMDDRNLAPTKAMIKLKQQEKELSKAIKDIEAEAEISRTKDMAKKLAMMAEQLRKKEEEIKETEGATGGANSKMKEEDLRVKQKPIDTELDRLRAERDVEEGKLKEAGREQINQSDIIGRVGGSHGDSIENQDAAKKRLREIKREMVALEGKKAKLAVDIGPLQDMRNELKEIEASETFDAIGLQIDAANEKMRDLKDRGAGDAIGSSDAKSQYKTAEGERTALISQRSVEKSKMGDKGTGGDEDKRLENTKRRVELTAELERLEKKREDLGKNKEQVAKDKEALKTARELFAWNEKTATLKQNTAKAILALHNEEFGAVAKRGALELNQSRVMLKLILQRKKEGKASADDVRKAEIKVLTILQKQSEESRKRYRERMNFQEEQLALQQKGRALAELANGDVVGAMQSMAAAESALLRIEEERWKAQRAAAGVTRDMADMQWEQLMATRAAVQEGKQAQGMANARWNLEKAILKTQIAQGKAGAKKELEKMEDVEKFGKFLEDAMKLFTKEVTTDTTAKAKAKDVKEGKTFKAEQEDVAMEKGGQAQRGATEDDVKDGALAVTIVTEAEAKDMQSAAKQKAMDEARAAGKNEDEIREAGDMASAVDRFGLLIKQGSMIEGKRQGEAREATRADLEAGRLTEKQKKAFLARETIQKRNAADPGQGQRVPNAVMIQTGGIMKGVAAEIGDKVADEGRRAQKVITQKDIDAAKAEGKELKNVLGQKGEVGGFMKGDKAEFGDKVNVELGEQFDTQLTEKKVDKEKARELAMLKMNEHLMAQMGEAKIEATSARRIGAGGAATSTDPAQRLRERMYELNKRRATLEQERTTILKKLEEKMDGKELILP
jgi:hypothetical protein